MVDNLKKGLEGDEISIKEIIQNLIELKDYFWSYRKFIIIIGVVGALLGLAYSFIKKPIYTAELTFVTEEESKSSSLGSYAGLASQFGLNLGGLGSNGAFSGDNLIELLKSRHIIENALLSSVEINNKNQLLINYYLDINYKDESLEEKQKLESYYFPSNLKREDYSLFRDSLLGSVCKKIRNENLSIVRPDKKLNMVSVKFNSNNEVFAKVFVEELMKSVSTFYVETKTKKSRKAIESLENRTDSVKALLDGKLYGLAVTKDENMRIVRARGSVNEIKQSRDVQILNIMYAELVKNLELTKMTLMRETPLIQVIDAPILPLEKNKFSKAKGIVLGGFFGAMLVMSYLWIRRIYSKIVSETKE